MQSCDSQPCKTPGRDSAEHQSDNKPARITVETPGGTTTYDCTHHIRSDGWVSVWTERDGTGIDVQVPRERVISIERGEGR